MEPRIQYTTTSDGVNIAYSVAGEGAPLVHMPYFPLSHLQAEWRLPELRRWHERLAHGRMLVRFDGRGCGLSEQDLADPTLEARLLDLEAVVDRLNLEKFALYAALHSGPVAVAYAARHPERVSHLALWCAYARASDWYGSPVVQGVLALAALDWETFTETAIGTFAGGWGAGEFAHRVALLFQESLTQQAYQTFLPNLQAIDVNPILPSVTTPTLVLHRREINQLGVHVARGLAARIPNARLALLEGQSVYEVFGETEPIAAALDEFLGEGQVEKPAREATAAGEFRTVLFTDMEGSTPLTQQLGDAKAQEALRTHNLIVRDALKSHGGSEIKHTGDGIMASFGSASRALDCAIAIQREFATREAGPAGTIRVRIGINAGEPVAEEADLFGTAVQLAARICAQGEPGQILVSNVVRELTAGKRFLFSDLGDVVLRGFEDPVRLYEVRWREQA